MKTYWPEYKPGKRKTDLCDHCECFRKKIVPRTKEFLMRAKRDLEEVCPGYWEPVLKKPRYRGIFAQSADLSLCTQLLGEVVNSVHQRSFRAVRQAAPESERIPHVEGALRREAALHKEIVDSYNWHLAAAQLEQSNMRLTAANLGPNRAYCHCDYMEKLPIPLSGSETSGQFHGAQRKTLSVFAMYAVEADAQGRRTTTAIILLSEILELSALFGSLCVHEALTHIKNIGRLEELILGFDAGNHFRSYENMYHFLYKYPKMGQLTRLNYLVEKHGKAFCDSEVFSPIRRWLDDFLQHPESFADDEEQVAAVLRKYARREQQQNPDGTKFIIKTFSPDKPRMSHYLQMDADSDMVTRTYSWEGKPTGNARFPVRISNCVFSHSSIREHAPFSVCDKPVPEATWKKGYWQDPTWRRPAIEPGETNEILKKYRAQLAACGSGIVPPSKRTLQFDEMAARDEQRLLRALANSRRKRQAEKEGRTQPDMDASDLDL
eukprot:s5058_g7.t1